MRFSFLCFCFFLSFTCSDAETLHVGTGYPFASLAEAIATVDPGDVIVVHEGTYPGGLYFEEVQGTSDQWIFIEAAPGETVIFDGGNNAWQFTDAAYLHIRGFIFEHQAGNGLNFDDGGSYETPAHDILFEACIFRDMDASGNNDLLKLSGLDNFEIRDCLFLNGADGGSGIDMVGCHDGLITGCYFEDMGSNGIQAKGGTRNIRIEANYFKNAGQRSLNLGGSTGLQFFRPLDAEYEAADLKVYSNIFVGSTAPVAYVGCINTEVTNNTIYLPENWVLRILQETVDTSRFFPCGNNSFINNLIVIDNSVNVVCNIGPNTAPETFTFSNNLWYHLEDPGWNGPVLPVTDSDHLVGQDPLLNDPVNEDYSLQMGSPAIGSGLAVSEPEEDFDRELFNSPRSIGAIEGNTISATGTNLGDDEAVFLYPNPAHESLHIQFNKLPHEHYLATLIALNGSASRSFVIPKSVDVITINVEDLSRGIYLLRLMSQDSIETMKICMQ